MMSSVDPKSTPSSRGGSAIALVAACVCVLVFFSLAGPRREPTPEHATPVDAPGKLPTPIPAPPSASETPALDESTGFIKGPGWETVAANCTGCHSAKLVTQNRGDRAHWEEMIRWMQRTQNLWTFAPEIEDQILTYLSTYYGQTQAQRRAGLPADLMPPPLDDETDPRVARARAALAPLKQQLMGALKEALPKGAPYAVSVCQQRAPEIAHALSRDGVAVGRTSHRVRNPKNLPTPWMEPLLDSYKKAPAAPGTFKTAALAGGGFGYVEPIYVGKLCLKCHGSELEMPVLAAITKNYPDDKATGFAEGEFRGLFWVELPPTR